MDEDLESFVQASFRTVWSLELFLRLYREPGRFWTPGDLVVDLRSSDAVVAQSVDGLLAAGLVVVDGEGAVAYRAGGPLDALAAGLDDVYRRKPAAVRRLIVQSGVERLQTFADAFKLRK
jgi:hypothetical protein